MLLECFYTEAKFIKDGIYDVMEAKTKVKASMEGQMKNDPDWVALIDTVYDKCYLDAQAKEQEIQTTMQADPFNVKPECKTMYSFMTACIQVGIFSVSIFVSCYFVRVLMISFSQQCPASYWENSKNYYLMIFSANFLLFFL